MAQGAGVVSNLKEAAPLPSAPAKPAQLVRQANHRRGSWVLAMRTQSEDQSPPSDERPKCVYVLRAALLVLVIALAIFAAILYRDVMLPLMRNEARVELCSFRICGPSLAEAHIQMPLGANSSTEELRGDWAARGFEACARSVEALAVRSGSIAAEVDVLAYNPTSLSLLSTMARADIVLESEVGSFGSRANVSAAIAAGALMSCAVPRPFVLPPLSWRTVTLHCRIPTSSRVAAELSAFASTGTVRAGVVARGALLPAALPWLPALGVPPAEVEQRTVQRAGSPHQQGAFPPGLSEPCPAHCHGQPAGGVAGGGKALLCESSGCAACEECALVEEEAAAEEEESGGEECRCDRSHPQCGRDGWRNISARTAVVSAGSRLISAGPPAPGATRGSTRTRTPGAAPSPPAAPTRASESASTRRPPRPHRRRRPDSR